jgi:hypothetical protein
VSISPWPSLFSISCFPFTQSVTLTYLRRSADARHGFLILPTVDMSRKKSFPRVAQETRQDLPIMLVTRLPSVLSEMNLAAKLLLIRGDCVRMK